MGEAFHQVKRTESYPGVEIITVSPTRQDGKGKRFWAQGTACTETTGSHKTTRKLLP